MHYKKSNKYFKKIILFILVIIIVINYTFQVKVPETIKVGILHSRTGTLAFSEEAVLRATLAAIDEINNNGGLLSKYVEPIIADGKSDPLTFAREAERLITAEKVDVIFGCWTSASRKEVKPIIEKYKNLLFYPVQYEGMEESSNIIYTGAAPNQQIIPGLIWSINNLGKEIFLVGSDYIFPRITNEIIKNVALSLGAKIVGEEYIKLGSKEVNQIINKIELSKPNVIINTLNGDSNIPFFKEMNIKFQKKIHIMSFSISEPEMQIIGVHNAIGSYACWNYFETIQSKQNKKFKEQISEEYGPKQLINDPMEAAYFGVHLWAKVVKKINTTDIDKVKHNIWQTFYSAPEGIVKIDQNNLHTWKKIRIGKVNKNGMFDIIWESKTILQPQPFANNFYIWNFIKEKNLKSDWQALLEKFYKEWGNKWAA